VAKITDLQQSIAKQISLWFHLDKHKRARLGHIKYWSDEKPAMQREKAREWESTWVKDTNKAMA